MKASKGIFFLSLLLVSACLLLIGTTSLAASIVSYEGGADAFVFLLDGGDSGSDLFTGFKRVMPGDVLTQEVMIRNNKPGPDHVNIYLRAVSSDQKDAAIQAGDGRMTSADTFLNQLTMKAWNGPTLIFDASPANSAGLTENVLLGSLAFGEHTVLKIELTVPLDLGNDFAYQEGNIEWVFLAEEVGPITPTPPLPQTGERVDRSPGLVLLWMALAALLLYVRWSRKMGQFEK